MRKDNVASAEPHKSLAVIHTEAYDHTTVPGGRLVDGYQGICLNYIGNTIANTGTPKSAAYVLAGNIGKVIVPQPGYLIAANAKHQLCKHNQMHGRCRGCRPVGHQTDVGDSFCLIDYTVVEPGGSLTRIMLHGFNSASKTHTFTPPIGYWLSLSVIWHTGTGYIVHA